MFHVRDGWESLVEFVTERLNHFGNWSNRYDKIKNSISVPERIPAKYFCQKVWIKRNWLTFLNRLFSQHFQVCVYIVFVSRRCVVGQTRRYPVVLECIRWVNRLQLGRRLRSAALRCRFGHLQSDDFRARLSELVTQLELHYIDAHWRESETEN